MSRDLEASEACLEAYEGVRAFPSRGGVDHRRAL